MDIGGPYLHAMFASLVPPKPIINQIYILLFNKKVAFLCCEAITSLALTKCYKLSASRETSRQAACRLDWTLE